LRKRWLQAALGGLLSVLILAGGYAIWYVNRPLPDPVVVQTLFAGVTYDRVVQRDPYPLIYHVVTLDLTAPGLGFLVTPPDDLAGFDYRARTTSQFLEEFDLQIAVNGDFYDPWRDYGPWDYYPHPGDGINARGLAVSQGHVITTGYVTDYGTLHIDAHNQVTIGPDTPNTGDAVSGLLLQAGEYVATWGDTGYMAQRHPRTAAAIDVSGTTLRLIVVDGRQPNYSEGMTLPELAALIRQLGGYHALNLDGGGSSTLVMAGTDGRPFQLGSAIHTRLPGRERPVANHLGVYASR
jgi:hypothetical protein